MNLNLTDLKPGQKALIVNIENNSQLKKRLAELGIREGKEVFMRRDAPMGDPIEINIMGYNISLRKSEAINVFINNITSIVEYKQENIILRLFKHKKVLK